MAFMLTGLALMRQKQRQPERSDFFMGSDQGPTYASSTFVLGLFILNEFILSSSGCCVRELCLSEPGVGKSSLDSHWSYVSQQLWNTVAAGDGDITDAATLTRALQSEYSIGSSSAFMMDFVRPAADQECGTWDGISNFSLFEYSRDGIQAKRYWNDTDPGTFLSKASILSIWGSWRPQREHFIPLESPLPVLQNFSPLRMQLQVFNPQMVILCFCHPLQSFCHHLRLLHQPFCQMLMCLRPQALSCQPKVPLSFLWLHRRLIHLQQGHRLLWLKHSFPHPLQARISPVALLNPKSQTVVKSDGKRGHLMFL